MQDGFFPKKNKVCCTIIWQDKVSGRSENVFQLLDLSAAALVKTFSETSQNYCLALVSIAYAVAYAVAYTIAYVDAYAVTYAIAYAVAAFLYNIWY